MILFNKLVNNNCIDHSSDCAVWSVPFIFTNAWTGFHARGLLNVKIIKEDNSSVFTADEQLGEAKKKIFNRLLSHC